MANSPTYGPNPFAVTNADDPLSVFKLTPNPIQRLSDALSLIVNLGQQQKAPTSAPSSPQRPAPQQPPSPVPQRPAATPPIIPISQTWRPAPPPTRPFPTPIAPTPVPSPIPTTLDPQESVVSTFNPATSPGEAAPQPIPTTGELPDMSQTPISGWGAPPTATDVTSNVSYPEIGTQDTSNQDTGFWSIDPFGSPQWVGNPGYSGGSVDPNSSLADLGNAMYGGDTTSYDYFDFGGGGGVGFDPGMFDD